ncbi:aminotransferase class III-fold pyridoxal phosphate-dependent enzyme [Thermosipho sp. (in: thermotogales)]|uniref:aspartate aminotransferase family protein n=1 Tax=Thermosipho sp. (in: thermotogales) TaxID=1968895 RepID=UPI002580C7DB|nr:aminotransferase class III-fold pyridoxal phosphate-dependent enzyme [Thermosipho sp. (in: thermotogales)]MBZ4649797.1 acetylornithine aminotransferase [Thermosipho sp. (in: thermotogales)]
MFISNTYKRLPIKVKNAKGIWIYDESGEKYLDTFSGIGVLSFGHCDEEINKAISKQIKKYTHISNFFIDENAIFLAKRLVEETKKDGTVFFANSGTEANEAALKAIKKLKKGIIISFENNFHGRSIGSLSITGFQNLREQFEPLLSKIAFLPFNDSKKLENFIENEGKKISAIFVECVHGSGGLDTVDKDFVEVINKYKDIYDYIVVADEVQAGLGRTGEFYSYQNFNLNPDIVTVAKSLGGGLPLSAAIFTGKYKDVFSVGDHGSTFAPNPVSLAAGKTVINRITKTFLDSVKEKSSYLKNKLLTLKKNYPIIKEIKGIGLMLGIEMNNNNYSEKIIEYGLNEKILLNVVKSNTIRLLPALNITHHEIDEMLYRLEKVIKKLNSC